MEIHNTYNTISVILEEKTEAGLLIACEGGLAEDHRIWRVKVRTLDERN